MSNNYASSAGRISFDAQADLDAVMHFYQVFSAAHERALEIDGGYPFKADMPNMFVLTPDTEGRLFIYWKEEDYFDIEYFCRFMQVCLKRDWLSPFISGSSCWYSDKPWPDEFGGAYFRVTSEEIIIVTTNLDHLSNDELRIVERIVDRWRQS